MGFMEPQIVQAHFTSIETSDGIYFWPESDCPHRGDAGAISDEWGVDADDITTVFGYGARMSAPGYSDCSDWTVHESEGDAARELLEHYADDMSRGELRWLRELEFQK